MSDCYCAQSFHTVLIMITKSTTRLYFSTAALLLCCSTIGLAQTTPLRALLVGGGPEPEMNQFAIESNVKYVERLLGKAPHKILFADGQKTRATVQFHNGTIPSAQSAAFAFLFDEDISQGRLSFRKTSLPIIDGPSSKSAIVAQLQKLGAQDSARTLLYFTGHGGRGKGAESRRADLENNLYYLWDDDTFSVREMAQQLQNLPKNRPTVLVMVQCFSGSFANLIFQDGDPDKPYLERDFCGFFAAVKERPAAGCTPEIDEAEYEDFTSAFFSILSGQTRTGQKAESADYDQNGRIGMDEAFAHAVIHEDSIDVPIMTSDALLRQNADNDEKWLQIPYSQTLKSAAPWQSAILEELSASLKLSGEDRIARAWQEFTAHSESEGDTPLPQVLAAQRNSLRNALISKFPGLKAKPESAEYQRARAAALLDLKGRDAQVQKLLSSMRAYRVQSANDDPEIREARLLRLVRAARTLYLESELRAGGDAARLAAFERLRSYEARNPLAGF